MTTESDVMVSIPDADKRELTREGRTAIETMGASLNVSTWDILKQKFKGIDSNVDLAKTAGDVSSGMTAASMVTAGVGVGLLFVPGIGWASGPVLIAGALSTTTGIVAFAADWEKSASLQ